MILPGSTPGQGTNSNHSSTGKSTSLLSSGLQVRVLLVAPTKFKYTMLTFKTVSLIFLIIGILSLSVWWGNRHKVTTIEEWETEARILAEEGYNEAEITQRLGERPVE